MLNGKWSSQKFQDEQINEKFGVAFSDGDICIFCYNINVGSIPSELRDPGEKTVPRMVKFRKQRFRFEHVIFKRFHIKRNNSFKHFKQCLDN
jgi:hypothetical protein